MNRRELLKSLPALAAIPFLGVSRAPASVHTSWRVQAARKIISESGEMWLASAKRWRGVNPIVVAFEDTTAVEIRRDNNHWKLLERPLSKPEFEELTAYKHDLYYIQNREPRIGDRIGPNADWRLRAYIKNGRRPGWIMSCGKIA